MKWRFQETGPETVGHFHGLTLSFHSNAPFMDKFPDLVLWVILPLLLFLPMVVHAETVRCATELKRVCDPSQACTATPDVFPATEYFIDLQSEQTTVRIAKKVGGKRVTNWKAGLSSDADGAGNVYAMLTDSTNRFSLSKSLNTFSYRFPIVIGNARWEQHEVGTCSMETP